MDVEGLGGRAAWVGIYRSSIGTDLDWLGILVSREMDFWDGVELVVLKCLGCFAMCVISWINGQGWRRDNE